MARVRIRPGDEFYTSGVRGREAVKGVLENGAHGLNVTFVFPADYKVQL
jgi:hypothetical protein